MSWYGWVETKKILYLISNAKKLHLFDNAISISHTEKLSKVLLENFKVVFVDKRGRRNVTFETTMSNMVDYKKILCII